MSDTTSNDDDKTDDERGALADRAKRMLDRGKDVATGVTGAIVGAADDASESVKSAGTSSPDDASESPDSGIVSGTSIVTAATTSVPSAPAAGFGGSESGGSGSGGSGSGGSGSGGSGSGGPGEPDDDEGAFLPGLGISGSNQIIILGLIVAGLLLFGSTIWSFLGGDDDIAGLDDVVAPLDDAIDADTEGPCADLRDILVSVDVFADEDLGDLRCRRVGDRLRLWG